ncbi:PepSY-associated TM helix domain-containing protein [Solitalea lacus]|uniref:PepSY-associated TM helix domain-containing protein n=1 Tax=Solitalea lacus TaxID=2911172 RepID=UPI001EDBC997|nr:PepSY-associated TM helix domain-containing protein [Solitalea lacus]UKJ09112.1 PepSY domain-containing protein [Solitalea lacus]
MSNILLRKTYKIHKWVGLISGLLLLIIALSGSILVFREDINKIQLQPPVVSYTQEKLSLGKSIRTIAARYPDAEIRLVNATPNESESLQFSVRKSKTRLTVYTHPVTGVVLKTIDANSTLVVWMLNLHYNLHAGLTGKTIVLVTGILFLLSIITGFIIYRKSIWKVLSFNVKVNGKNKRSLSSSLHRTIGVWSLLLNFILALTGIIISFSVVSTGFKKKDKKSHSHIPLHINCNIDSTITKIKAEHQYYTPNLIRIQAGSQTMQIGGSLPDDFPLYFPFVNRIKVDLNTGKVIGKFERMTEKSVGEKFNELVKPLHFGEYGGLAIKFFYCLAGLSIPFLSITGFALWMLKRRQPQKTKPILA